MEKLRAILIDDEPKALKVLEHLLGQECPDVQIIGRAASVEEGVTLVAELRPDLLFLDITLPDGTGFDLLQQLEALRFEVIFTTSHDNYMMEAIRFCAIGYILKPIGRQDLRDAVQNALRRRQMEDKADAVSHLLQNNKGKPDSHRIGIPTSDSVVFFPVQSIIRCEGKDGYTSIVIKDKKPILSSYNLGEFRRMLNAYGFWDVHKSHLINPSHIVSYTSEGMVTLSDTMPVPVSRRKRSEFLEQLKRIK